MAEASNQQILEKAIQKAIDGGWKLHEHWIWTDNPLYDLGVDEFNYEHVIYSHDFAKALWPGNIEIQHGNWDEPSTMTTEVVQAWKSHLQRMVIADDPIKYLGDNL